MNHGVPLLLAAALATVFAGCVEPAPNEVLASTDQPLASRISLSNCHRASVVGTIPSSAHEAAPASWPRSTTTTQYILAIFDCQRIGIGESEKPGQLVIEAIGPEGEPRACQSYSDDAFLVRRIQHVWTSEEDLAEPLASIMAAPASIADKIHLLSPTTGPDIVEINLEGERGLRSNFLSHVNKEYDQFNTLITTYFGDGQEGLAAVHVQEWEDRSNLNQGIAYGTWPERPLSPGNAAPHPGTISLSYGSYEIHNENLEGTECADA